MIDHLMLQGLKPLSQETGIEDPNKEIEALEYWKRFSSVPPITQMPIQSTNVENNENLDNSISPDELIANKESQEPEPGSYYTDDHLKDNSNNQEVQERKKDGRQLLFEERFPEAIDSDIKYDANNRFDYDASVNAYYERNNIGLRKDKYGTHLLPGYEHLIVNPEDIKESPYAATEKQIMDNIKKHTHELSYSALAGYYYGIDELLDSGISQENINKYFKYDLSKLSKEEQNLRYKKAVVEDILKHAINPEIEKLKDQYLQTIPLGVKPDAPTVEKLKDQIPEETLDYIYDKWWLLEGKDMIDSRYGKTSQQIRDEFLDAKKRPTSEINHLLRVEIPNAVRNKEMPFTFNSSNDLSYQVGPLEIRRFETSRVANDAQNRRYTNLLDRYKQHFNSLDDETKKQTIQEFKELSRQAVPYYYNEFEGTDKLPLNDAQYAQFLAEFYAQADIYGDQQAIQNLTDKYKNIVASNTSWLENKWSAVKQGAVNLAITATGWFVAPIAETIIESSGYSEEYAERYVAERLHIAQTQGTILPWDSAEATARHKKGLPGFQQRHYSSTNDIGISEHVDNLIESSGYMGGFVLGAGGMGKVTGGVSKMFGKGFTTAAKYANANNAAQLAAEVSYLAKKEAQLGKVLGQLGFAAANANLEASSTSQDFIQQHRLQLDQDLQSKYNSFLQQSLSEDLDSWIMLYKEKTGVDLTPSLLSPSEEIPGSNKNKVAKIIFDYFSKDETSFEQFKDKDGTYDFQMEKIYTAADAAYTTTFSLNFFPELVLNTSMRQVLLPKSMTRSFKGSSRLDRALSIVKEQGTWKALSHKVVRSEIAKEYGKNIIAESFDEFTEEVSSNIGTGVAESILTDLTTNKYSLYNNTSALGYDLASAIGAGFDAGYQSVFSQEALTSGIYGGISAAFGLPAFKGSVDWSKRRKGESLSHFFQRVNPVTWDSIFTLPFDINDRVTQEQKARDYMAEYVNAFLQDSKKQKLFENANYATNLLNKLSVAQQTGDPKLIEDAEAELLISTMSMMAALKGTDYYNNMAEVLQARVNFSKENLSDPNSAESQAVQEYLSDQRIKGPVSHEAALEGIIKSAKKAQAMIEQAEKKMKEAYSQFGDDADIEFIQDVVTNELLLEDRQQRYKAVDDRIEDFHNKTFVEDPSKSSKLSPEAKKMATIYGTGYTKTAQGNKKYSAEAFLEQAREKVAVKIAEIEADPELSLADKKKRIKKLNNYLKGQSKKIEAYRNELENLTTKEKTLTAEEILNLDVEDQMRFLSREDHSKEQKAEIKRLGSLKQDIITRGQLLQEINRRSSAITQLALNPVYMMDYHAKSKAKAKAEIFKMKYSYLNREGISYEDFRKEYYDTAFGLETQEDADLLDATVQDNIYYDQLKEEQKAYNKIIHEIVNTSEYEKITSDDRKKANLDALLSYCSSHGIPIDPTADFDTIVEQLAAIPNEDLQKALDRVETSSENKILMSAEELAQMLKSVYNGVNAVREGVEKRNAEPQNTDATTSNNADRNPEVEEKEEKKEKVESNNQNSSDKTLPPADDDEDKNIGNKNNSESANTQTSQDNSSTSSSKQKATTEELIQTTQAIQSEGTIDFENMFNWIINMLSLYNPKKQSKTSAWGYLLDKSKTLSVKDQEALQPILAAIESRTTGTPVEENYPQSVAIEGHTGRRANFMRKYKSYQTLAENEGVKEGAKLRFYTPKELSDAEGDLPVVALIESKNGSVSLQGKRYAPIGYVTPTQSMRSQNPNRSKNGDFFYKETGTIQDVKKEGFAREHHHTAYDVPVKEAMKSDGKTSEQVQQDFLSKVKVDKDSRGKTVLQYPVTRGTGNLTVDVDISPASPQAVKNKEGKNVFEDAKAYRETKQTATDENTVVESADKVINHNEYTKRAAEAIDRIDKDGIIITLSQNPNADVSSKLQQIWKNVNSFLRLSNYDAYTLHADNVQVDENGNVSFDLVLKLSSNAERVIPITSIAGVNARQGLTREQKADVLTGLLFDSQGEERGIIYPVNYTITKGKIDTISVGRAFRSGVLVSNKPSFSWPATSLSFKYEHNRNSDGALKSEGLSSNTDNAVTAHTSENTVTTIEGKKVDADTGISQDATKESTPEIVERVVENQLTSEEIIETVAEEMIAEDPLANNEEDYSTFGEEDDYDDEDEYQMVVSRKSKIAKVKDFFKSLVHSLEGKEIYDQIIEEATSEFEKYTTSGAFSTQTAGSRGKAKKEAEKQAEKIRAKKLPHVRSVKVIQNEDKGYSLQIKYNTYKRYLDLKAASAETMTDAALKATIEAFSDKQKVLNPTPEVAKKQLSIFQRFSAKNLKEKFNSLISTPFNEKFEHLLTEVLSLHGIKVMEKDIRESNGHDVLGAINTAGNIIYLAKGGNRNSITLAEETAHSFVKNIVRQGEKGDPVLWELYQDISASITETSLYKETLEEYRETYTDKDTGDVDYEKIKQEAVAKAMSVVMSEKYDKQNAILSTVSSLLTNTIEMVKSLLGKSNISTGAETILYHKLNNLVDQVMKKDVKQVKKQQKKDMLNVVLEALGINTKDKHVKSEAEKQIEKRQKDIVMNSSSRTIRFEYLTENTKQTLNKLDIKQEYWQFYPIELQEQLLKCLSRA